MNTCKTCKHWKHHGPRSTWGSCEHIKDHPLVDIYLDLSGTEVSEHIDIPIIVDTLPDFGCILWEQKETPWSSTIPKKPSSKA